jgi:VWFA-related protein
MAGLSIVAQGQERPVFRSAARSVSVDVAVRDGNLPVLGLEAADFVLYDGDQRQTIDSVTVGAVPIDATLFLGTNNQSSTGLLGSLNADIKKIVALLRPDDRVRLLTLENQVTDIFGWRVSGDPDAVANVQVGGVQSLYDACFLALMHRPDPDRRHLILAISDGVEFGSVVDSSTVRDVARRAEAVLHLVFVDPSVAPPLSNMRNRDEAAPASSSLGAAFLRVTWLHVLPDVRGLERLQEAAQLTGGTVRHSGSGESVVDSFRRAFDEFRQSYVLRYTPKGVPPEGWHDLRVEMAKSKKYTIRARKGYFGG